jgi:hypothetical protein
VIRHFLYVIIYSLILGPFKIYILLRSFKIEKNDIHIDYNFCLYCNLSIGMIMFFIRSFETNFYNIIFCYYFRKNENNNNNRYNYFINVPLTSIISRNMNMEFMCCILYGLTDIFKKDQIRKDLDRKKSICEIDDFTLNLINDKTNNLTNELTTNLLNNKNKFNENFTNDNLYESKLKSFLPNELRK